MFNDLGANFEQVRSWLESNLSWQTDPVTSLISGIALIVAVRANRRSAKILADERNRAGNISKVIIHDHSMQAAVDRLPGKSNRKLQTTPQRDSGAPEGFVCSVYSGDTDVEVESVYLKILFTRGLLGQERWEIRLDLEASEGLAVPPTPLPFRMKQNSRLDWILPTFVTFFPGRRGQERKLDAPRLLGQGEQLCFEFGAYSRVNAAPVTARKRHRFPYVLPIFPARGGPWTKVVKYSSLWAALTSPTCPDSLKGWFLEWLECRVDFQERIDADKTGTLRDWFHQVVRWHYWPPGRILIGPTRASFGDPESDTPKRRASRTFFALPDMSPIDSGPTVSGPGGSSELSQFRLWLAFLALTGTETPTTFVSDATSWPSGLNPDDPVLEAATEARHSADLMKGRQLTQKERTTFRDHLSAISLELSRCTYLTPADCDKEVELWLWGSEESSPVVP